MVGSKSKHVAIHGDTCSSSVATIRLFFQDTSFNLYFLASADRQQGRIRPFARHRQAFEPGGPPR